MTWNSIKNKNQDSPFLLEDTKQQGKIFETTTYGIIVEIVNLSKRLAAVFKLGKLKLGTYQATRMYYYAKLYNIASYSK